MLINRTHIVQHDVVFIVFLPVVFVSLPQVSTCLQEHIIVQCFVRMNIFTLPNKEPLTLQFVFIPLEAATDVLCCTYSDADLFSVCDNKYIYIYYNSHINCCNDTKNQ